MATTLQRHIYEPGLLPNYAIVGLPHPKVTISIKESLPNIVVFFLNLLSADEGSDSSTYFGFCLPSILNQMHVSSKERESSVLQIGIFSPKGYKLMFQFRSTHTYI